MSQGGKSYVMVRGPQSAQSRISFEMAKSLSLDIQQICCTILVLYVNWFVFWRTP